MYVILAVEIVRGRANPGGRQQGYRGVGVRVWFSNPSYTLTLKQGTLYPYPFLRVRYQRPALALGVQNSISSLNIATITSILNKIPSPTLCP
jgi:hypothetical protein